MLTTATRHLTPVVTASFLEGPASDEHGNVFVSDIQANRILRWSNNQLSVYRSDAGRANGNVLTRSGWLYTAEGGEMGPGGRRRITRTHTASGVYEVLTESFEGQRYNSPNDLTVGADGTVWFTDPRYGDRADLEMDVEGIYRLNPDNSVQRVLGQEDVQRPNGIALSPDGRRLYVVDSHPRKGGSRRLLVFAVHTDGTLGSGDVFVDFGAARGGDGIKVDVEGRVYVCAGVHSPRSDTETNERPPGVYVFDRDANLIEFLAVPIDLITNCCFGGADAKTLYVTAGHTIFQIPVDVSGHRV